jgi:O-antigen/teichoic acid export membrane protein
VVNEAQLGTLSGFEAFKEQSLVQFIAGVAGFPFAVAGVYWFGLTGAVWGLAIGQALVVFFNFIALRKLAARAGMHISWKLSAHEFRVLWSFSLPTLLGASVYVPAMWMANTILVNIPNGYSEMGIFSAADRWRTAIRFVPSLLAGVALPMLSSLQATSNREKFNRVLWANVKLSFGLSLAAALPIAFLARGIMASYGHGFAEGKWVLVNLSVVSVITATSWILSQALASKGRVWAIFFLNVIWGSVLVGACYLLRYRGAQGLAFAYLAAESARLLWLYLILLPSSGSQADTDRVLTSPTEGRGCLVKA